MGRTALLVLDMFNLFDFPDGPAMARAARRITPAILRLRQRFDRAGAPVVQVNDNFADWLGDFSHLVAACAAAGGTPAHIARQLAPQPGHYYVLKPKHSGFLASPLAVLLAQLRVQRLVVTGIAADSCVLATAQDANMREYGLWIPGDCVASRTRALTGKALSLMSASLHACTRSSRSVGGLFPANHAADQ